VEGTVEGTRQGRGRRGGDVEDRLIAVGQSRNADGLAHAEATARPALNGPNVVPRPRPTSAVARMLRQLTDPLVVLLLAALTVTLPLVTSLTR
jgi:hypothetical protein